MKVGKITQLSNAPGTPNEPRVLGTAQVTLSPEMLLGRIVRLEQRLTDLALRVWTLENKKPKEAR